MTWHHLGPLRWQRENRHGRLVELWLDLPFNRRLWVWWLCSHWFVSKR
jgi:hypothetical protein